MIDLKALLEYQEIDARLREVKRAVEGQKEVKDLMIAKANFQNALKVAEDSAVSAEKIVTYYRQVIAEYEETAKKVVALEKELETIGDDNESGHREIVEKISLVKESLASIEKTVIEQSKNAEQIINKYTENNRNGKKSVDAYNELKVKVEALKKEAQPKMEEIMVELKNKEKSVPIKLLERYKALVKDKKIPPVVGVHLIDGGKSYGCMGCGLTLKPEAKSDIDDPSKGVCECDNCRRIVYKAGK